LTLALSLLAEEFPIYRMMTYGAAPVATALAFVGSIASLFSVGSSLSGFVILLFDGDL
jgi:hypothetical protein